MLQVKLFHLVFPKAASIAISFQKFDVRDSYLLLLKYKNMTGVGAGNPFKPITGDSDEEFINDAKTITTIPLDPQTDGIEALHVFLNKRISSQSLKSAIDGAYHDLLGQLKGVPVYKLYSKKPRFIDNSVTVFIKDTIEETANEAKRIFDLLPGLRIMKIKLKGKDDIERTKAIKSVSPKKMKFVVDANQGYKDPVLAVQMLLQIGDILGNIILVEEPCPKGELDKLKYVKENIKGMMVFADESMTSLEDAKKIVAKEAAHGINIKLQKVGGFFPALQIAKYCEQYGLKFMIGAMLEDFVGLTTDAHFAVTQKNAVLTDLDTDLDIPRFIQGGSSLVKGKRVFKDLPGLGFTFDPKTLETCIDLKYEEIF